MASSPVKRRKLSPTSNAPTTPSRIPIARTAQTTPSRPSFASPTKASIAKHNPQLLTRSSSRGAETNAVPPSLVTAPENEETELDIVTETAATQTTVEDGGQLSREASTSRAKRSTTPVQAEPMTQSRTTRSAKAGLASGSRQRSRTPGLSSQDPLVGTSQSTSEITPAPEGFNPFAKRGLRRSNVGAAPIAEPVPLPEGVNPFEKKGLRRSPIGSQSVAPTYQEASESTKLAETPLKDAPTVEEPSIITPFEPIARSPRKVPTELAPPIQSRFNVENSSENVLQLDENRAVEHAIIRPAVNAAQSLIAEASTQIVRSPEKNTATTEQVEDHTSTEMSNQKALGELSPVNEQIVPEEPNLPPTPVQRGVADPVVTTPPSGIHDTPSKRPKRRKEEKAKTSPAKPLLVSPRLLRDSAPVSQPNKVRETIEAPQGIPQLQKTSSDSQPVKKSKYPARRVNPVDPHDEKKRLRNELLQEIEQLQTDAKIAEIESERLRRLHDSKATSVQEPENMNQLVDLLLRTVGPKAKVKRTKTSASIFSSINKFLPFSAPPRPPEPKIKLEHQPVSHAPLPQEDPLPYLQVFSSLTYTCTTNLLPQSVRSNFSTVSPPASLLRQHNITASHRSGCFSARLEMVVDTASLSITSLTIPSMTPEAVPELGMWAVDRARGDHLLGKDISTICWGMSRWVEVSIERAKFWLQAQKEIGDDTARKQLVDKMTQSSKRKRGGDAEEEAEAHDELAAATHVTGGIKQWSRREMLPMLAVQSMTFYGEGVEVTFSWTIAFDWTGEAESAISAMARVPASWEAEDERKSFKKIPQMFQKLVQSKGPLVAARTIVALLMPT